MFDFTLGRCSRLKLARAIACQPVHEARHHRFSKKPARVDAPLDAGGWLNGLRRDHELAAIPRALRLCSRQAGILLAQSGVIALCPPQAILDLPADTRGLVVSLTPVNRPMAPGCRWPLERAGAGPRQRIGTSNGLWPARRITVDAPGLL